MIFPPGSRVRLMGDEREARVLAATFREHGVEYEVAWWVAGTRYTAWVQAHEIGGTAEQLREIGFKTE